VEPPIARVSLISWSALLARPVKSMARFILKISADATERARPVLALWCAAVGKYAQALVFSCAVALSCRGEPRRGEEEELNREEAKIAKKYRCFFAIFASSRFTKFRGSPR
jgi:hypothetical protein